jgi:transcriptional regulator with XRE-family HTH domain
LIGDRIKQIRKINGLNQKEFANLIGISQGTLSDIENGKCNPSAETLLSLKMKYSVDINWLLLGNSDLSVQSNKEIFNASLVSEELELIFIFRDLNPDNQNEIIEFIKLKIVGLGE